MTQDRLFSVGEPTDRERRALRQANREAQTDLFDAGRFAVEATICPACGADDHETIECPHGEALTIPGA